MQSKKTAATFLDERLQDLLSKQLQNFVGHEQEAVIELVRSADFHAYLLHFFKQELTTESYARYKSITLGIGPALCAFLPKLEQYNDGIPWRPSNSRYSSWSDTLLKTLGEFTMLRRLANCERYGLVSCDIHSESHISIRVINRDLESIDRIDQAWLVAKNLEKYKKQLEHINKQLKGWALKRIDKYVDTHMSHFIRYDSDWDLLDLYQQLAYFTLMESAEADALPDEAVLGPRTFGEWKKIAISGIARAQLHLSFATRLSAQNRKLNLRNLLTIYVRHDDLRAIWQEQTGVIDDEQLAEISDAFMLTATHANEYFSNFDYPLPYNIRFGRYFALLPQFGYLNNAGAFLVNELKRKYRRDWDTAVNQRELKFQKELYALLPTSNYSSGRANFKIIGASGRVETDIDAIIFEKSSNSLYLFQLKWFDVFGHSLKERQSKLTKLLEATEWIERVHRWLSNTPKDKFCSLLAIKDHNSHISPLKIHLVVLTRYTAKFSGSHKYDERAAWISWPSLCRRLEENIKTASPLEKALMPKKIDEQKVHRSQNNKIEFNFPGLRVDLYT